jgi:hypothetical protein
LPGTLFDSLKWCFTAVNFLTGKIYQKIVGEGNDANYDNHYSAIALHPDPTKRYAYIPVNSGIVKVWPVSSSD